MLANYLNPVHTVYGAGAVSSLPQLTDGRRVALVTFPEAAELGMVDRVAHALRDSLVTIIDQVAPNPDVVQLGPVYDRFWQDHYEADVIVALGGGSTIDTAKALMVETASRRFSELAGHLANGRPLSVIRSKTLIAVPTTAGTGSEVTPWATVWDRAEQKKYSLHLSRTWPDYALIDPQLMLSLPASVTLQSGLDALSHALEAIWNVNANPVSDMFAVAAIHEVLDTLPCLLADLGNLRLRGHMALAALKAGLAFSNTKTALAHSISYEMTLRYGLPHGIACSFPLPLVLRQAIGRRAERDHVLGLALGQPLSEAPDRLARFIEGLGVKTQFADYGVGDDEAARIIRHARSGARGKNFIGGYVEET